jgi:hypothetical protein
MKLKTKRVFYWIASSMILIPLFAGAQFNPPTGTNLPEGSLMKIITSGMNWLLAIVGILGVVAFAIAGILYLTSAGDEKRIETAKKAMLMAIVGVIVALMGLVIITAVKKWLGGTSVDF